MSKKPVSQKRAEREREENLTLSRVFHVFLLGLAAECYLFLVYRGYNMGSVDSLLIWHQILTWGTWIGLVMAIAGAAVGFVKRQDQRLRTGMTWVGGIGLFLAVSGWVVTHFFDNNAGITAMCIMVPILAVLGLVFLLFQHECFLSSIALTGALFTVWVRGAAVSSGSWRTPVIIGAVFGAVILALAAGLTYKAQQGGGKLWGVRVYSPECDYRILYGVLGVAFVCVLLALAVSSLCYYLMWVLGVLLFAELVYYTTKLM